MNCSHAKKILYPTPEKCAPTIETARAMEHLRQCAQCKSYFESQADWSRSLKEKVGIEPAPEPLRERIAHKIEKRHANRRWKGPWVSPWKGVAASVLLLSGLWAIWQNSSRSSERFFEELCKDHIRYRTAESQIQSSDPAVIESWFSDKTGFGVHVPALQRADLVGARLCFLQKHPAALVFYRKGGRTVSMFQFSGREVSLRALSRSEIDGVPIWRRSLLGYTVAAFERRGVICAMVSDLRESQLLEMASAAQAQSQGY